MPFDSSRADAKRSELVALLHSRLVQQFGSPTPDVLSRVSEALVEAACRITPPENPPLIAHLITMAPGGMGGGRSTKPGNVTLNVQKFLVALAKIPLTAAAVNARPWTAPFAFLVLWDELVSRVRVEIDEREASVVWTLWVNKDAEGCVAKDLLLGLVNDDRKSFDVAPLAADDLKESVKKLRKLRCVEDWPRDQSKFWIRESVGIIFR
jgi:hypothetical protein